jgi:hypothetical protein
LKRINLNISKKSQKRIAIIVLIIVAIFAGSLYYIHTAPTQQGIIDVKISGSGYFTEYYVTFTALTSNVSVYNLELELNGNSGLIVVSGFTRVQPDLFTNNATLYHVSLYTETPGDSSLSFDSHIVIIGPPLSYIALVKVSSGGTIASWSIS